MVEPLPFEAYEPARADDLISMIVAPQLIDMVLIDTDNVHSRHLAKLVGWTVYNTQIYLRPDGCLAFVGDQYSPADGSVRR